MSPAKVAPRSSLTMPSWNLRLQPEKKRYIRKEEWVPTWKASSPFVKKIVEKDVISEYLRKNQMRSRAAAAAQRLGATANVVRQNRPKGMRKGQWKRH